MKKSIKILLALALVILVLAGGAFWAGYRYYTQACEAQQLSYALWQSMRKNAEDASVSVTELDQPVGTYSLKELGLLPSVLTKIDAQFDEEERISPQQFRDRPILSVFPWMKDHTEKSFNAVTLDPTGWDGTAILEDLRAASRIDTVDEAVYEENGKYCYIAPVQGNRVDEQTVLDRVEQKLKSFVITPTQSASGSVAITEDDYPKAALLGADEPHSAEALFERKLKDVRITVHLGDPEAENYVEQTLPFETMASVVTLDESGKACVDRKKVEELAHQWAEKCQIKDAPYVFTSYDDGPIALDFMKIRCDYQLDEQTLVQKLLNAMQALESCDVEQGLEVRQNGEEPEFVGTYIEVNIDRQTVTFYKDGELIVHSDVVTGNLNGHQTPVGIYHVQTIDHDCWLEGEDYKVFVKYWVGFNGCYGLHDSQWRNHFGGDNYVNNGSHGCVNTPDLAMEKIYNTAEKGDTVIVHGKNQWYTPHLENMD